METNQEYNLFINNEMPQISPINTDFNNFGCISAGSLHRKFGSALGCTKFHSH